MARIPSEARSGKRRAAGFRMFPRDRALKPASTRFSGEEPVLELILLGVGAPPPTPEKSGPRNGVVKGGKLYLADAARRAATQIVKAGFRVAGVDHPFFTHFHSDHYTGFGDFFLSRWIMGAGKPLRVYGPSPVHEIVRRMLHYYEYDINLRVDEGKPGEGAEVEAAALAPGDSIEVDGIEVRAEKGARHGNVDDILSYSFAAEGRKIVMGSDGSPTEKLASLARGADVLVMRPCVPELTGERFGGFRGAANLVAARHAAAEEVGRTAARAGAGKLVFSHVVPPLAPNEKVREAIAPYFDGPVIAGEDLMRL